jgi:cellulose synthase/poly-beta-1,6-N-acetylglucosamine synthase-like glycosyltransferase
VVALLQEMVRPVRRETPGQEAVRGLRPRSEPARLWPQALVLLLLPVALVVAASLRWDLTLQIAHGLLWLGFAAAIAWRWGALGLVRRPGGTAAPHATAEGADLPRYSIAVPLFAEPRLARDCIDRLKKIDYPVDRLDVMILVQDRDEETAEAVRRLDWACLRMLRVPSGGRADALNAALSNAWGKYLAVFDPEEAPHPQQLREAVKRFQAGPATLACLQAPVRILRTRRAPAAGAAAPGGSGFLEAQLAAEQAVLFELTLPALARLSAPFPLGDASCHFRVEALREVGGWDATNIVEESDLGFRMACRGLHSGLLDRASWRAAPADVRRWLPQRTRWLKGQMQTLAALLSRPAGLGRAGAFSLVLTLGLGLASAFVQAPMLAYLVMVALLAALQGLAPALSPLDLCLLTAGLVTAALARRQAVRRSGAAYGWTDAVLLPFYGALTTLAGLHAAGEVLVAAVTRSPAVPLAAEPDTAKTAGRLAA